MKRPLPTNLIQERVRIYRNLNDKCLSVMYHKKVVGHAQSVLLNDIKFIVLEGGRQRAIIQKRKNVHAFIEGVLVKVSSETDETFELNEGIKISYNPYMQGSFFIEKTGQPVHKAKTILINSKGILAYC